MINCKAELEQFHAQKVRLPETERKEMRDRRETNQKQLKSGLSNADKSLPLFHIKQGSYAMHTMTQHPKKDYDIDDGAVFLRKDLTGPRGGDMTPREARDMVRSALDTGSRDFKSPPETLKNCVRVYYATGYHVDIPVYRQWTDESGKEILELASSEWRPSDPRELTKWFQSEVSQQSPDTNNGQQMRRLVCLLKWFARIRSSWNLPSGLILSVLTAECYTANSEREDTAFYNLLVSMRDRLKQDLCVFNPVDSSEELSKGSDDPKMKELEDRLTWAIEKLASVFDDSCDKNQTLDIWDEIFKSDFFKQFKTDGDPSDKTSNRYKGIIASAAAVAPKSWAGIV